MSKSKSNAKLLRSHKFAMNGLKVYGKPMKYDDLTIGDVGLVEELNRFSKEDYPTKTHWFKPKKWKYTWHFAVTEGEDFEFI
jgi:hypothetical protein